MSYNNDSAVEYEWRNGDIACNERLSLRMDALCKLKSDRGRIEIFGRENEGNGESNSPSKLVYEMWVEKVGLLCELLTQYVGERRSVRHIWSVSLSPVSGKVPLARACEEASGRRC